MVTLAGAGALITRIGSRASALAGSAVLCLGLPLVALAPSLPVLAAALFVLGCGNGLLDVSMNAHAARVESEYGRPIFAGFHAFWNIGGLAGSGIAAIIASLRIPVAAEFAGTGIVLLAVSWLAISRCFLRDPDQGQGEAAFALPGLALLPLGIIAFCGFVAEGTVNDWSAVYLTRSAGASLAVAPLGYFAFSLGMIAVRLAADRLAARFGVSRLIRLAVLVGVAGFAVVIAVAAQVVDILGFAVVGLGISAVVPLAWSSAARKEPKAPGRAISAVATSGYLGFLLGPVMIGGLAGLIGLRLALIAAAALTLVIFFLAPGMTASLATTAASHRSSLATHASQGPG